MSRSAILAIAAAFFFCHCAGGGGTSATPVEPSARPSAATLALKAEPDPVAPGGLVTLSVRPASGGGWEAAPPITVHLPPGAGEARTESAGWVCQAAAGEGDAVRAEAHTDVSCVTALAGRAPELVLEFGAPAAAGTIRTCVTTGRPGRPGSLTCVESTVK